MNRKVWKQMETNGFDRVWFGSYKCIYVLQIEVMETKVHALREGSVLVTPEEGLEVQVAYDLKLGNLMEEEKNTP
jgi:hypothetical protein